MNGPPAAVAGGCPAPAPGHHDVIGQTRTLAARSDATAHRRIRASRNWPATFPTSPTRDYNRGGAGGVDTLDCQHERSSSKRHAIEPAEAGHRARTQTPQPSPEGKRYERQSGFVPVFQILAEDIHALGIRTVFGLMSDNTAVSR